MPTLRYDDFDNVKARYPQQDKDNSINYAFAGGGAAMLLLTADKVVGRDFKDSSVGDERNHKDLDIAAFNSVFGIRKNRNRHDVYGINFGGPLLNLDYAEKEIPRHGIYVEVLRNTYFGFKVPTTEDTVVAIKDGKKYITLSPEFVAASKAMGAQGFREGVDDADARALLQKFDINKDYLASLAQQSEFRSIVPEIELPTLENLILSGDFYRRARSRIIERYQHEIPFASQIPYGDLVNLLKFNPGEIVINDRQREFMDQSTGDGPVDRLCTVLLLKYHSHYDPESLGHALHTVSKLCRENKTSRHRAVAFTTELNKLIAQVEQVYKHKKFQSDIATQILNSLSDTPFLYVKISQYQQELERIQNERNRKR